MSPHEELSMLFKLDKINPTLEASLSLDIVEAGEVIG
jgi:hypothetical protein